MLWNSMKEVWNKMTQEDRRRLLHDLEVDTNPVTDHIPVEKIVEEGCFTGLPYYLRWFLEYSFDGRAFTREQFSQIRLQLVVRSHPPRHDFVGIDHLSLSSHD